MRFSVIVPLYNKAPYVKKALTSVLSQTFTDYELIVVNDGSTDGSLAAAQGILTGTDAMIIDQRNAGVSVARNNGVAASHGDYVCFLDADDWWEPAFLERMSAFIAEYPDSGIWCSNYNYVKNGKGTVRLTVPTGYINYFRCYADNGCMPVWTGAVCLSRALFQEFGGFKPELKLGEDFDLWARIALNCKVAFLDEALSNYNQDVNLECRSTRHLLDPRHHMLWNLDYLEGEELSNPDYKQLIDNLRTYALLPYFISREYHAHAEEQLRKVNWNRQGKNMAHLYRRPLWFLRLRDRFLTAGSRVKQFLLNFI